MGKYNKFIEKNYVLNIEKQPASVEYQYNKYNLKSDKVFKLQQELEEIKEEHNKKFEIINSNHNASSEKYKKTNKTIRKYLHRIIILLSVLISLWFNSWIVEEYTFIESIFNIILIAGFIYFWLIVGAIFIFGMFPKLYSFFSKKIVKKYEDDKSAFDQFMNFLEPQFKIKVQIIKDEIKKAMLKELIDNTSEHFTSWKSNNPNKYPFKLDFFFEENYEPHFLAYSKYLINNRKAHGEIERRYSQFIQYLTIIETDKIMMELGAQDYKIAYLKRSTNDNFREGMYLYNITNDNFTLYEPPYKLYTFDNNTNYLIFNVDSYQSMINNIKVIQNNNIVDFNLFGTELMQSTVFNESVNKDITVGHESNIKTVMSSEIKEPGLVGTIMSQLIFGTSYTVLKGVSKMAGKVTKQLSNISEKIDKLDDSVLKVVDAINNISIQTKHEIKDTRAVQIVFSDKSDVIIEGVEIYYDLNRFLGDLKKVNTEKDKYLVNDNDVSSKIKEYKKMLDDGIINQEEFQALKNKLLGL
jgi:hypothetical protein